MARRLLAGALLVSVTALSATGCSGSDKPKSKEGQQIAWAGKVCDAVGQGSATLQPPQVNAKDSKSVRDGYVKFLGTLSSRLKIVETGLRGAGSPPVNGGQAAMAKATANLQAAQTAVVGAGDQLSKTKTGNTKVFQASLTKLGQSMTRFADYAGPVKDLRTNPELSKAFDKAPSCQSRKL